MLDKSIGIIRTSSEHWVRPTDLNNHGFIGLSFVRQHMVVDEHWCGRDLRLQFKSMGKCLAKHHRFRRIESQHLKRNLISKYRKLRKQCHEGRQELQTIRRNHNRPTIRNLLEHHKELQCLYQDMTVDKVKENIDQRTFVMRKKRDGLGYSQQKLERELKALKLKKANLEDRIKFHNLYELKEENQAKNCEKSLANSNMRLKGIMTINMAYKKIVQILKHDEIFYEPILQSLHNDIEEQGKFIKHILDLGQPTLGKFKKLKLSFKQYDDTARRNIKKMLQDIASTSKSQNKSQHLVSGSKEDDRRFLLEARERYMRTTFSMADLESELENVEDAIKNLKFATLCSVSTEVLPRIKGQIEHNCKLKKRIVCDTLSHAALQTKEKFSEVLQGVIKNNLTQLETERLNRIAELNRLLENEDKIETETIEVLKRNNDLFVILRVFLWNIYDMLRHVYKSSRLKKIKYPNSYLNLPLLRFEMMTMYSCAPDPIDDDVLELYRIIHRKMMHLITAYHRYCVDPTNHQLTSNRNNYMGDIVKIARKYENLDDDMDPRKRPNDMGDGDNVMDYETKENNGTMALCNRIQLKARSLHLIEEQLKKY